jgi:hypothetical protein
MKYTLSNGQQKELLLRGQPLLIAIPLDRAVIDDGDDAAAMQHAAESLVCPPGIRIVSARVDEIIVGAPSRHDWPPQTLAEWLGPIVPGDRPSTNPLLTSHVVVLAIVAGPTERHDRKPPAWPGGPIKLPEYHP